MIISKRKLKATAKTISSENKEENRQRRNHENLPTNKGKIRKLLVFVQNRNHDENNPKVRDAMLKLGM